MSAAAGVAGVVVTGLGVQGAGVHGLPAFARALAAPPPIPRDVDSPGIRSSFEEAGRPVLVLALPAGPPPPAPPREARRLSRPALMALAVAGEALALGTPAFPDPTETGIALGTGYGSVEATRATLAALEEEGSLLSPNQFVASVRHEAQAALARVLGLRGPAVAASARRLSFEDALAWALVQVERGRAPRVLALGVDEITPLLARVLSRYRLLAGERIVWGEGAGALLLESEASARARGARPLARVAAWAAGAGSPADEAAAIAQALERSGIDAGSLELFLDEAEGSQRRARERARLLEALRGHGVEPALVRGTAEHVGHLPAGGALAAVAGVLAVSGEWAVPGARPGPSPRGVLVSAREADGAFFAYVLTRGDERSGGPG